MSDTGDFAHLNDDARARWDAMPDIPPVLVARLRLS